MYGIKRAQEVRVLSFNLLICRSCDKTFPTLDALHEHWAKEHDPKIRAVWDGRERMKEAGQMTGAERERRYRERKK